jgi:hypothetical protein
MYYKEKYLVWVRSRKHQRVAMLHAGIALVAILTASALFWLYGDNTLARRGIPSILVILLSFDFICYLLLRFLLPGLAKTPDAVREYAERPFWWPLARQHKSPERNEAPLTRKCNHR